MNKIIENIKEAIWTDKINRNFLLSTILLFVINLQIWQKIIYKNEVFVYTVIKYYPLQIFVIVFILHLIMSIYSYEKDEKISHLFLGFNLFLLVIIFITEMLYIYNK